MKTLRKYGILLLTALLSTGCNSQESNISKDEKVGSEPPKGSWKVHREFNDDGELIRYDSIYTWSSENSLNELGSLDRDSILQSMQSRFYKNFSQFDFDKEGFGRMFGEDSLFIKRFFNEDFFQNEFGKDFMDLDKMYQRMEARRKQFLDRYHPLIELKKEENSSGQD
ncbi:hypothetical protein SAMN04487911_14013 [Arenibacter nanhaiticus]|uniref:Lipoprotein n=1 Tax=Arenibacter nanhaiticus TaxID=558155 RepID=A0A1M6MCM1_9FLAO|nr:hypothetical protein [Arenibacter nanhaiticus]SHJ81248.1 hypothetical protein SAMN04487911_14013 [Arenibacter nanhaiticus]